MAAMALPKYIVIKSQAHPKTGNAYYRAADGSVLLGEPSMFSDLVKIEAERSTSNDKHVNLRFCSSNRYWEMNADGFVVARSKKPQEDVTKPSCTLFVAVKVDDGGMFYLSHVASGGRVLVKESSDMAFYVESKPPSKDSGFLTFVDWVKKL